MARSRRVRRRARLGRRFHVGFEPSGNQTACEPAGTKLRFVLTLICGCHAPASELPGEDMAAPTADLRRPRADLSAVANPDLANPGPGIARWAKNLHERPQSSMDGPVNVAVDRGNHIVIASTFRGSVDLGGGPLQSDGATDLLLVKYDANGSHV